MEGLILSGADLSVARLKLECVDSKRPAVIVLGSSEFAGIFHLLGDNLFCDFEQAKRIIVTDDGLKAAGPVKLLPVDRLDMVFKILPRKQEIEETVRLGNGKTFHKKRSKKKDVIGKISPKGQCS